MTKLKLETIEDDKPVNLMATDKAFRKARSSFG